MSPCIKTETSSTRYQESEKRTRVGRLARHLVRSGMLATVLSTSALAVATAPALAVAAPLATCGPEMVCIYPQTRGGGNPFVTRVSRRITEPVNNDTRSVRNHSKLAARIYRSNNYTGSWTCVNPGTMIDNLGAHAVGIYGSSVRVGPTARCG